MNTKRLNTPILAGSQLVFLCGVMLQPVSAATAADPASGAGQIPPLQLAQTEFFPSKWPGKEAGQATNQGMEPGSPGMMGPGGRGMMAPGMGPGSRGMMGPGMMPPANQPVTGYAGQGMMKPGTGSGGQSTRNPDALPGSPGMMPPGMGPAGWGMMGPGMGPPAAQPVTGSAAQGMAKPGTGGGGRSTRNPDATPGSPGMMGPGMGPRGPAMMAGPMGGSPMAMLGAIGALDLDKEQRGKYDTINQDLDKRMREIADRINTESEKLRKLQEEQMRIGRTLDDLQSHMMQATVDAANRAEELLTDEQRQAMFNPGRPFMMQPPAAPSAASQGGNTE